MSRTIGGAGWRWWCSRAPALKCGARDRWIGWAYGVQFGRLHLVTNNSRFLILPGGPPNLGSRVLSLCARRLVRDWPARFGHDVLLAETFVDPALFPGHGLPRGQLDRGWAHPRLRPAAGPATARTRGPSWCSFIPCASARGPACAPPISTPVCYMEWPRMTLTAAQMRSLPACFQNLDDPPPPRGPAPRAPHGAGAGRRRDAVRHARLQGDERMGRRPQPQGVAALRRAPPRRPAPPTQPVGGCAAC